MSSWLQTQGSGCHVERWGPRRGFQKSREDTDSQLLADGEPSWIPTPQGTLEMHLLQTVGRDVCSSNLRRQRSWKGRIHSMSSWLDSKPTKSHQTPTHETVSWDIYGHMLPSSSGKQKEVHLEEWWQREGTVRDRRSRNVRGNESWVWIATSGVWSPNLCPSLVSLLPPMCRSHVAWGHQSHLAPHKVEHMGPGSELCLCQLPAGTSYFGCMCLALHICKTG